MALLSISLNELLNRFLEDCRLRNMTERSIVGYKSCIACFFRFLSESGVGVREVDNQILKDFLGYLKYSKKLKYKTVKWYFSAISGLYDFMVFEGMIGSNLVVPFRRGYMRQYKDCYDDSQRRLLSLEEMSNLINSILDPRDRAIATLLAKT
ncbi:MAG: phage integrase N-terminal SAM-like domain-containing protein [Nitrososphaerota archaeon]|nr:phage integrase N-terminal SAM-like domain-containing protein [Candidatus Verstraetearchaeota archaeon]